MTPPYPSSTSARNRWIAAHRPPHNQVDPSKPYAFLSEEEPDASGNIVRTSTIFLTNRECPWKCVMCDLWRNTTEHPVPPGTIPAQIDHALAALPPASQVKLYNSGSFFDLQAIPISDHSAIAARLANFNRVIVESHPLLVGQSCLAFRSMLHGQLEVAMGLETARPEALNRLNKGMTLDDFAKAARFLRDHDISLRTFLLVQPPFIPLTEAEFWLHHSIDFAFDHGASVVSLIPTRAGNGAMEQLQAAGDFTAPTLANLERAANYGLSLSRGRIFADLWDLHRFSTCPTCFDARRERLHQMNLTQRLPPPITCPACGTPADA
jgi:radical SAM enzyme (TIGR01210 family)